MSLITLAEQNNLPNFQFIDKDTLSWIADNKPKFTVSTYNRNFVKFVKNKTRKFPPHKAWFLRDEGIDSIHGIRHIMRVIANIAYHIKEKDIVDEPTIINALIAASLHDLRRKNDKGDEGHAERAAKWFLSNKNKILSHYDWISTDNINVKAISTAILFHEQYYKKIINDPEYIKNKTVVDLLKLGDALDRYRLPKLKWWINNDYLSLTPSEEAKLFSFMLVLESETIFLEEGGDSVKSVLKAFDNLIN